MAKALTGEKVNLINFDKTLICSSIGEENSSYETRWPVENIAVADYKYEHFNSSYQLTKTQPQNYFSGVSSNDLINPDSNNSQMYRSSQQEDLRSKAENEVVHLRDKISSLFRENCSLKEQTAKIGIDNRFLQIQVADLKQENTKLRDRLHQYSQQMRSLTQSREGTISPANVLLRASSSHCDISNRSSFDSSKHSSRDSPVSDEIKENQKVNKMKMLDGSSVTNDWELAHERRSLQLVMTTYKQEMPNEVQIEKELFQMLDNCQKNCDSLKKAALIQNKFLMELVQEIKVLQSRKRLGHTEKYDPSDLANNKIVGTSSSKVPTIDQLINNIPPHVIVLEEEKGDLEDDDCINPAGEHEWVCPMCQAVFPKVAVPLNEFEIHVMEHFKSDEFEIIPRNE